MGRKKLTGRSTKNHALLMGAQIKPSEEECALGVQRPNDAVSKDAQTKRGREEYALGMVQRSNDAAVKDAQTLLSKEECA